MSHFTVLVPANDEDELAQKLMPYKELGWGSEDPPELEQYLEFNDTEDENRKEYEEITIPVVELSDGRILARYDEEFRNPYRWKSFGSNEEYVYPDGSELYDMYASSYYNSFEQYMSDWKGVQRDERTGRYGYWHNPNAKWDWWSIGGRWTGILQLKTLDAMIVAGSGRPGLMTEPNDNPALADYAPVGGVDWDNMLREQIESKREQYRKFHNALQGVSTEDVRRVKQRLSNRWNEGVWQDIFSSLNELCFGVAANDKADLWLDVREIKEMMFSTENQYIDNNTPTALTYAFIDMDGNWNQRGEMGWWGIDDKSKGTENYDEAWWEFINSLPEDQIVYVIDCHI